MKGNQATDEVYPAYLERLLHNLVVLLERLPEDLAVGRHDHVLHLPRLLVPLERHQWLLALFLQRIKM